jgi:hypothetical protein
MAGTSHAPMAHGEHSPPDSAAPAGGGRDQ